MLSKYYKGQSGQPSGRAETGLTAEDVEWLSTIKEEVRPKKKVKTPGARVKCRKRKGDRGTHRDALWPGAAILVVAAPQVVYLSARLGFTLRDDTISCVMKP